ncbi:MAG: hypothetical protein IKS68_01330, partial [Mailhella sp.]|nr:hypothetical protein [Mailhella sp.]
KRIFLSVFLGLALTAGATSARAVSVGGSLNLNAPGLGVGITVGNDYYGGSEYYATPSAPVIVQPAPVYQAAPPPPPPGPRPHGPVMRPQGPGPRPHGPAMRPGPRPHGPAPRHF